MLVPVPLDFAGNEIKNVKAQSLASDPAHAAGQFWYNSAEQALKFSDGSNYFSMKGISDHGNLTGLTDDDHAQYVHNGTARTITAVHTFNPASAGAPFIVGANGTNQLVTGLNADKLDGSDASAFSLTSHNHAISALNVPIADVDFNSQKIINLATPISDNDAANKLYVDSARAGLSIKDSVRAATTANITLSGSQTIDGITLVNGDRVLVKNQTTGSANGIYLYNSAGAWTRALDANTSSEVPSGTSVWISEGTTQADQRWTLTTNDPITLGTTSLTFTFDGSQVALTASNVNIDGIGVFKQKTGNNLEFRGINSASNSITVALDAANNEIDIDVDPTTIEVDTLAATVPLSIGKGGTGGASVGDAKAALGFVTKVVVDIGDGSATTFVLIHNLNTRDVNVFIRRNASPYDMIFVDIEMTSVNTITVKFSSLNIPTTNQFRAVIIG